MQDGTFHQIGDVAEATGLSLRTIRYWEEIGLVTPSGRTEGGFRLYTDADVERVQLAKNLKPLGMPLEAITELLDAHAGLSGEPARHSDRLRALVDLAEDHMQELDSKVAAARDALASIATALRNPLGGL
jgi:DNA-binding transcriptional MerR regulator